MMIPMGVIAGHGMGTFHPGVEAHRRPVSIGDQQADMALRACRGSEAPPAGWLQAIPSELTCLHCGAQMTLLEDRRIGDSLHLSAECPRCGCLRATYFEVAPAPQRFLELPQEASFD
jgi:hypothetical protein